MIIVMWFQAGKTPLFAAISSGDYETIDTLLRLSASTSVVANNGVSILQHALSIPHTPIQNSVKILQLLAAVGQTGSLQQNYIIGDPQLEFAQTLVSQPLVRRSLDISIN